MDEDLFIAGRESEAMVSAGGQGDLFRSPGPAGPVVLRWYQAEAVDAVWAHLRARQDNPCVVLPTAAGKTPVLATLCQQAVQLWGGRVLVVSHVRELIQQSAATIERLAPGMAVGVYSAGLGRRDQRQRVIVAGIQSIYKRGLDVEPFDLVIVDEAHLIPPSGEGMYRTLLGDLKVARPTMRVIGLTATPYRLTTPVCTPDGILNSICYEVGVRELIVQGYLCPLRSKAGRAKANLAGVGVRNGEFVAEDLEAAMDAEGIVSAAVAEIVQETAERRSVLVFASGVGHATHIAEELRGRGHACEVVTGDTPTPARDRVVARFRSGALKYLVNCAVFTIGFDAPNVDAVVLLRATMSPGLYYQMVGRGFRLHETKADCLVLDYGDNVLRHGPVDTLSTKITEIQRKKAKGEAPAKQCAKCAALVATGYSACPECGEVFPQRGDGGPGHAAKASTAGVLSYQYEVETFDVREVRYTEHRKRDDETKPPTMRVWYLLDDRGSTASEWICFEHPVGGFAQRKAAEWWRRRSDRPVPSSVADAVAIAEDAELREPVAVVLRRKAGDKWWEVVEAKFADEDAASAEPFVPVRADEGARFEDVYGDIPF